LPHVVNFELPNVPEDYVHRIGRTGRAGSSGEAMSLVCVDELKLLKGIERLINSDIPKVTFEGYEPDPSIKPEPIRNGRNNPRPQKKSPRSNNSSARNRPSSKPAERSSRSKSSNSKPSKRPDNFGNR
ncbi:MAG: helicase-related protein, partial [Cycloclasticus sp.]